MKFEDLKLGYGYPVQLQSQSEGQAQRCTSKIIGCVPGQGILMTPARGKARLRSGQKIVVRIMVGNGICLFPAVIESVVAQPLPMMQLSYPKQVSFKEIRGATRVDVELAVSAQNLSSLPERSSDGMIADISTSGARLEVADPIGEVGDELTLKGVVNVGPIQRELDIGAVIRSRIERSTREVEENLPAVYGVEFTEQDEDKLLLLYAFVYSELAMA